jgi:FkbM family methyltransferase
MRFPRFLAFNKPLGRLIRQPLRMIPFNATLRVLKGPLRGARWIAGSSPHGCWIDSYEQPFQVLFFSIVPNGGVVWDIGAHVGFYSLLAARKAAKVLAFEPLPENLTFLHRHVELNSLQQRIEVFPIAVSDHDGQAMFRIVPGDRSEGSLGPDGTMAVRTIKLDSLGIVPDLIKIDVEGNEYAVLSGARQTLTVHHPSVLVALHTGDSQCRDLLVELGYEVTETATGELLARKPLAQSQPRMSGDKVSA